MILGLTPGFTPKNVKSGVFALFKIVAFSLGKPIKI